MLLLSLSLSLSYTVHVVNNSYDLLLLVESLCTLLQALHT